MMDLSNNTLSIKNPGSRFIILMLLMACFVASNVCKGQIPGTESGDEDIFFEDILGSQGEDANYAAIYESLYQLYLNPINLNTAEPDDLGRLYILSENQVQHFLEYRNATGPLFTLYELNAITGWNMETIKKVLPFVTVEPVDKEKRPFWKNLKYNQTVLARWEYVPERRKGFTPPDTSHDGSLTNRYQGTPHAMYLRYNARRFNDFSFGFTMQHDAGEMLDWKPSQSQYGMDFNSYHLYLEDYLGFEKLAIGDFEMVSGQGLVFGSGFSIGKGAEPVNTARSVNLGIQPYTSAGEQGYFRGLASSYELGPFLLTGFYSNQKVDGRVFTDTEDSVSYISSVNSSGYHRTSTEIAKKNQVNERVAGTNIRFRSQNNRLEVGLNAVHTQYSHPVKSTFRTYNQFDFQGSKHYVAGLSADYVWNKLHFFGESAVSKDGGRAWVGGVTAHLASAIDLAMIARDYNRRFHSFYGSAFGENTRNNNEKGVYWGIKLNPFKKVDVAAYYDKFRFPWMRFRVDAPSDGHEYMVRVTYRPGYKTRLYAQFKEEAKARNLDGDGENLTPVGQTLSYDYRIHADLRPGKFLGQHPVTWQLRVQWSDFRSSCQSAFTHGYTAMQDLEMEVNKWKFYTRFALFDTDNYDTRQYAYENDVLNAFSIPVYNGKGFRYYFLTRYKLNRSLSFYARWARFHYRNQETVGSGLNEIEGSTKSEVKMQVRWQF